MSKTTVALLFGGQSSEHEVSCATAAGVLSAIDHDRFDVIAIGITKTGKFIHTEIDQSWQLAARPEVVDNGTRVQWPLGGGEVTVVRDGSVSSLGRIDVVFPLLHGINGEDGSIQGLLQLVGLPYVGNGVMASALAMDKVSAKAVCRDAGVAVADTLVIRLRDWLADPESALERLRSFHELPVFVKPSRSGSSVGVSLVKTEAELIPAIAAAFRHDSTVLVEPRLIGRELECSVLEGRGDEPHRVSLAGEIVMKTREFYDYEAKYLETDAAELIAPAELSPRELNQMQALARRAFDALGCSGLARTDFFLTEAGFVLTEVNTMPGFTPISMYPKLWAVSGLDYSSLVTELIELGLAAGTNR
jgi:D-alanine-D-alanine ligase